MAPPVVIVPLPASTYCISFQPGWASAAPGFPRRTSFTENRSVLSTGVTASASSAAGPVARAAPHALPLTNMLKLLAAHAKGGGGPRPWGGVGHLAISGKLNS